MNSDLPLLTIAIPTYNRSRYLVRLLDTLMPQLRGKKQVELLISDNASPDETPSLLEEYRSRGLQFRLIRNETNIGPDRNFVQCFTEACGKYVWIVGDDDIVLPGGLDTVINLLTHSEYDLVYLQGKNIVESDQHFGSSGKPEIEIIDDARTFVLRTHIFLTFITGNIVNKSRVDSLPHPPFLEIAESNLVQLGWVYTAARYFRRGAYIHSPIIGIGAEDRGGYALYNVFGTNLQRITKTWLVEPSLVRVVLNGTLQTFFPGFVLRSRLNDGPFAGKVPEELLSFLFARNYRYYLFLYPLIKLPLNLARPWLLLCRIVNRLNKAVGNPMFR